MYSILLRMKTKTEQNYFDLLSSIELEQWNSANYILNFRFTLFEEH